MLRISIDIIPFGNEDHRETLAVLDVINDGTGTYKFGNYKIKYLDMNDSIGIPGSHGFGVSRSNNFPDMTLLCLETEIKKYDRSKGFLDLIVKAFNKIRRLK